MSEKSFVDLEEHLKEEAKKEAEKTTCKPTLTEMAIQSIAVSFIKIAEAMERIANALEGKGKAVSVKHPLTKGKPNISLKFPEDLRNLLEFREETDKIIIKPKQFLGSERFARIREIVVNSGGQYVSAGKNSHFEVPKK